MALIKSINQTQSDEALVALYQRTNQQDFLAQLFLRYSDLVYGTCLKYLSDPEKAKDATMNIYYELVKKLKNHEVANFKSWLYVLSKNHCLMELRKQKRHPVTVSASDFMQTEQFEHLENVFDKEEQLQSLSICLDQLNESQKETVRLFYIENKCYQEIAALTGNDWNKVRSLIQNGRRNLKICMEKHG
jgi:RNA polymerase sigma-70 factor (ECF subfamily)